MNKTFTTGQKAILIFLKEIIGVEYLARDKEFGLHAYIGKPTKTGYIWDNNNGWRVGIKKGEFPNILWEDDEPVCINDYV